jgi:CRP-like cAMP-binding protein
MLHPDKINFYLSLFKDLRLDDMLTLFSIATTRTLAAGEIYIKEGETIGKIAYIKEGLIRTFQVTDKGEELTLLLRWEDQFIASHDNIFFQKPSRFIYQAVEATTLLEADYAAIQSLLDDNPRLDQLRYYFVVNMLAQSMARVESFVLLNPEERYQQLIREKPNLMQRVPDKYIATLLGITPVSLSRIRKRITSRQKH